MRTTYPAIEGEDEALYEGEFEDELEGEGEFEGEGEGARELEDLYELEDESEDEDEDEEESEFEDEALYEGEAELEDEFESEGEDEAEGREFDFEVEAELEEEGEAEAFANPMRRLYPDAELMAHLATSASQTESEAEAEAFIGALVPLAAKLLPKAVPLIRKIGSPLVRGVSQLARRLMRDPGTRRLIRAIPIIITRSMQSLTDQAANGRRLTTDVVVRTIARITSEVLGDRRRARRATNAVATFDRRWHASQRRTSAGGPGRRRRPSSPAGGYRGTTGRGSNGYRRARVRPRQRRR
ncbi:hypothetical protein ACQPX6_03085 [Actinomycetospora sp. CA-101289]|uniref:hypothetical protein n=1 Tax=Actinomycetospora sp. CA-101289 TaxID=3239893 RepID=UPI003D970474